MAFVNEINHETRVEIASCRKKTFYKHLSMFNYTTVKIIDYLFAWCYIPNAIALILSFLISYCFFVFTGGSKISLGISIFAFFIIYISVSSILATFLSDKMIGKHILPKIYKRLWHYYVQPVSQKLLDKLIISFKKDSKEINADDYTKKTIEEMLENNLIVSTRKKNIFHINEWLWDCLNYYSPNFPVNK